MLRAQPAGHRPWTHHHSECEEDNVMEPLYTLLFGPPAALQFIACGYGVAVLGPR